MHKRGQVEGRWLMIDVGCRWARVVSSVYDPHRVLRLSLGEEPTSTCVCVCARAATDLLLLATCLCLTAHGHDGACQHAGKESTLHYSGGGRR